MATLLFRSGNRRQQRKTGDRWSERALATRLLPPNKKCVRTTDFPSVVEGYIFIFIFLTPVTCLSQVLTFLILRFGRTELKINRTQIQYKTIMKNHRKIRILLIPNTNIIFLSKIFHLRKKKIVSKYKKS